MANNYKRQMSMKRKNICFMALLVGMAWMMSACGGHSDDQVDTSLVHNPNSAQGYNDKEKVPQIKFDKEMHDFGVLAAGENISYSFKFTNAGNADLIITNCEATCGCTVADYPRNTIAPGEGGYVTVTFNSAGKAGQQLQEVTVVTNAQPARTKLRIQAQVR